MRIDEHLEGESKREGSIRRLIYTSVDDCRLGLDHIHDLPLLEEMLKRLEGMGGQISRRKVVERRIRQLRKSVASSGPNGRPEGCG